MAPIQTLIHQLIIRMRYASLLLVLIVAVCYSRAHGQPIDVTITVNTAGDRHPISPLIYGVNNTSSADANIASRRQGGDRYTTYNWENNASNSGHWTDDPNLDHISDALLTGYVPSSQPAKVITDFHDESILRGCYSLVTLQAGYVARDIDGVVTPAQAVPNLDRWRQVRFTKGNPFTLTPDPDDDFVYIDELVNFLVNKYGPATSPTGIRGYGISNEPGLWNQIHPRCHPVKEGYRDIFDISIALASSIKTIDPSAEVFGGVTFGFSEMEDFQGAPDRNSYAQYKWYIDALLSTMREASTTQGRRLMDALDIHWYSEAEGDTEFDPVAWSGNEPDKAAARVQAPRSLWDATYVEKSWITGEPGRFSHTNSIFGSRPIALIPRLISSINEYYPGTKLAIGEFGYGGYDHISGGLAVADALGVFGRFDVYYANHWDNLDAFVGAAYRLYRNYDGSKSTFGDTSIACSTSDIDNCSAYAAVDSLGNLHLIVINKSMSSALNCTLEVAGDVFDPGRAWIFDSAGTSIRNNGAVVIGGGQGMYSARPFSASHLVFPRRTAGTEQDHINHSDFSLKITPNPVLEECGIVYHVPHPLGHLTITDVTGRVVNRYSLTEPVGILRWNRVDSAGNRLPAGVYVIALESNGSTTHANVLIQ